MTGEGTSCDIGELVRGIGLRESLRKGSMQIISYFDKVWHLMGIENREYAQERRHDKKYITFEQQDHNNDKPFDPHYNQERHKWWNVKIACYTLY